MKQIQLSIGFGQICRLRRLNYMVFILKLEVNDGIQSNRDKLAFPSQAMLPLKQPAIPHQDLTTAYLLGDSTRTNWSVIALESCLFHPDKSDAHEHMQNMLCGLGAALQAWLDTKLILVSRLSLWHKILHLKPGDLIVSAYVFIKSLHNKFTLAWWFGHAWYCFSDSILHAFRLTCMDFIIQFRVNLIIIICTKTWNGFAHWFCALLVFPRIFWSERKYFVGTSFKCGRKESLSKSIKAGFLISIFFL